MFTSNAWGLSLDCKPPQISSIFFQYLRRHRQRCSSPFLLLFESLNLQRSILIFVERLQVRQLLCSLLHLQNLQFSHAMGEIRVFFDFLCYISYFIYLFILLPLAPKILESSNSSFPSFQRPAPVLNYIVIIGLHAKALKYIILFIYFSSLGFSLIIFLYMIEPKYFAQF